jgi:hypothetical protein
MLPVLHACKPLSSFEGPTNTMEEATSAPWAIAPFQSPSPDAGTRARVASWYTDGGREALRRYEVQFSRNPMQGMSDETGSELRRGRCEAMRKTLAELRKLDPEAD